MKGGQGSEHYQTESWWRSATILICRRDNGRAPAKKAKWFNLLSWKAKAKDILHTQNFSEISHNQRSKFFTGQNSSPEGACMKEENMSYHIFWVIGWCCRLCSKTDPDLKKFNTLDLRFKRRAHQEGYFLWHKEYWVHQNLNLHDNK